MTQAAEQIPFPDYENPPVVEAIVGVQFKVLAGFTNAHLGAFWQAIGVDDWPNVHDVPLLPRQEERFTNGSNWGKSLRLQITQDPISRLQIRNRDGNRMVQLQNGRIHLNWIGEGGDQYPRYTQTRIEFENHLRELCHFVDRFGLGSIEFDQWETTYVNKIPQDVWKTPADWGFFRPLNGMPTIPGLIEPESFSGEWHFVIPERRGRLHIHWQHVKGSESDETSEIQLTLTARGPIPEGSDPISRAMAGIDLGRQTIVCSFVQLMSDAANSTWKLRDVPGCGT